MAYRISTLYELEVSPRRYVLTNREDYAVVFNIYFVIKSFFFCAYISDVVLETKVVGLRRPEDMIMVLIKVL